MQPAHSHQRVPSQPQLARNRGFLELTNQERQGNPPPRAEQQRIMELGSFFPRAGGAGTPGQVGRVIDKRKDIGRHACLIEKGRTAGLALTFRQ
jgi:hypothetical protein